ncbi:MAG: hypothetical protein ACRDOO_21235 [Actinomadura sp.]
MTAQRVRTLVLSGLAPVVLIGLLAGNQWAVLFAARHGLDGREIRLNGNGMENLGRLVAWLQFPSWRVSGPTSFVVIQDVSLLLLFAAVALLILLGARAVDPHRGAMGALVLGWWATVVAGGLVGLIRGLLTVTFVNIPEPAAWTFIWGGLESGAVFGMVYGWLTGLAMLLAFLATRRKEGAAAPGSYGPGVQGPAATPPPPPPPLPQRVPQSSYSPQPPGGQWPPPQQRQPSWPAQPGSAGYPPPPAYGSPAPDADPGPPDRDGTAT